MLIALAVSTPPLPPHAMKPSIADSEGHARRPRDNVENRKWRVGTRVERDLDGAWFPATIVSCDEDGTYEIEYEEDENREGGITSEELRLIEELPSDAAEPHARPSTARPLTASAKQDPQFRDSLLLQPSDYDPNKAPTVVLHHRGESHASSSAYIINGLENNIAAGNGLRGIRWLRVNTM